MGGGYCIGVSGVFETYTAASGLDGNIAIQDLTPYFCGHPLRGRCAFPTLDGYNMSHPMINILKLNKLINGAVSQCAKHNPSWDENIITNSMLLAIQSFFDNDVLVYRWHSAGNA